MPVGLALATQLASVRQGYRASWAFRAATLLRTYQAQAFLRDFRHETGGVLQLALRLVPADGYLGAIIGPCPEIECAPEPFREILREHVGMNVQAIEDRWANNQMMSENR